MKKHMYGMLVSILLSGWIFTSAAVPPVHGDTQPAQPAPKTAPKMVPRPDLYKGTNATGQKLTSGDKITAPLPLAPVTFYASATGSWYVSGTGQTAYKAQSFSVNLPDKFAGYILTMTYIPDEAGRASKYTIQIEIPAVNPQPPVNPQTMTGKMDIVVRANEQSDYQKEFEEMVSSTDLESVYQDPLFDVWVATNADHFRYGNQYSAEEGAGIWAVNRVIVDPSYLNRDRTAMQLSRFGSGIYDVEYISTDKPGVRWFHKIRLYSGSVNKNSSCGSGETGPILPGNPIKLIANDGTVLQQNGIYKITSRSQLSNFTAVTMMADHVVQDGKTKVKKDGWQYWIPNAKWQYERTGFGEDHTYNNAKIGSKNRVTVLYESTELAGYASNSKIVDIDEGAATLNLKEIIQENGYKKGKYVIRVYNDLYRDVCTETDLHNVYSRTEKTQKFNTVVVFE